MTAEVQHPPVKVETGTVIENPQQTNRQAESPPTIVTVRMVVDGKVQPPFTRHSLPGINGLELEPSAYDDIYNVYNNYYMPMVGTIPVSNVSIEFEILQQANIFVSEYLNTLPVPTTVVGSLEASDSAASFCNKVM